jgi:hypothetical protein
MDAIRALNVIVAHYKASEDKPLCMGNVEFWHPVPGFAAALCYSIPSSKWDYPAISADANRLTEEWWEEFCKAIGAVNDGMDDAREQAANEEDKRNQLRTP